MGRSGIHFTRERFRSKKALRSSGRRFWFGQGLLTRPSSATGGLPVLGRQRVTWRPTVGRSAWSGDQRRTKGRGSLLPEGGRLLRNEVHRHLPRENGQR